MWNSHSFTCFYYVLYGFNPIIIDIKIIKDLIPGLDGLRTVYIPQRWSEVVNRRTNNTTVKRIGRIKTNNDPQISGQKTTDWATRTPRKPEVNWVVTGKIVAPTPLVSTVVLRLWFVKKVLRKTGLWLWQTKHIRGRFWLSSGSY